MKKKQNMKKLLFIGLVILMSTTVFSVTVGARDGQQNQSPQTIAMICGMVDVYNTDGCYPPHVTSFSVDGKWFSLSYEKSLQYSMLIINAYQSNWDVWVETMYGSDSVHMMGLCGQKMDYIRDITL
jgi:hypothetical protein